MMYKNKIKIWRFIELVEKFSINFIKTFINLMPFIFFYFLLLLNGDIYLLPFLIISFLGGILRIFFSILKVDTIKEIYLNLKWKYKSK